MERINLNLRLIPTRKDLVIKISTIIRKIIPILLFIFISCGKDSEPKPSQELTETEIEALFNNNNKIEGDGTLFLQNEEVQISNWEIKKIRYDYFGETGFGLNIYGRYDKDTFSFFSKPIINKSGTYTFGELTGDAGLYFDLGTDLQCKDHYSNDSGTISIDFSRTNIEVTISYLADYITEEPFSQGCLQSIVSTDSHEVEVQLNFPLYSQYFN